MAIVSTRLDPNLKAFGEVQEFNFPNTQNRGRVDIRTELAPTTDVPTQSGLTLKDSAFNGYRFEYESCLDATQNKLGLYKVTNNVRAAAPILWVDNTGKVTFNSEAFAQAPTLDNHVATKKYVDDHSGGGGGGDATKAYVDQQDAATLQSAKTFATSGDTTTLASAKSYADTGDTTTLNAAKDFAQTNFQIKPSFIQYLVDWTVQSEPYGVATLHKIKPATDYSFAVGLPNNDRCVMVSSPVQQRFYFYFQYGTENAPFNSLILARDAITVGSIPIKGVANPTDAQDVATKSYVDSHSGGGVSPDANGVAEVDYSGKATPVFRGKIDAGKAMALGCAYASGSNTNYDSWVFDSSTRSLIYRLADSTGSSSDKLTIGSSITAFALSTLFKNNGSTFSESVYLNGNGDGWKDTYSETWSNIWSRTISFKTTTYLTFQNASGTITISASQPIVMSSTYTPTAAKYVATKDYVDAGAVPIGGIIDVPLGYTLPSNFLLANGSSFNPGTYPTLYSLLGSSVTPTVSARVSGFKCIIRAL